MAQESKQVKWRWIWAVAAVLLIGLFFAVRELTRDRLQVRVVQVSRQELVSLLSDNGRVEPEMNYELHSPLATSVKAVYVRQGDQVPAGKVLAVLDDMQARARVATAESGVKAAQAALEAATHNGTLEQQQGAAADIARARLDRDSAQHDLDTLTKLNSTGAASGSEVAAARQRLVSAQTLLDSSQAIAHNRYSPAEVERARSALADAQANLAAAQETVAKLTVKAPAAGTVYSMDVVPTAFVEDGKLLMQIADLHHLRVRGYFDEPDLGKLAVGQQVVVKWDARPDEVWKGHIESLPSTVTNYQNTRNVGEVLIKLDDPDGQLLPNTNVRVDVTTSTTANTLSVPREAIHRENGQNFVYRVVGNELKRTPVTTGAYTITRQAILSGLNEGDWVATGTTNGQPLQQGMPIKEVQ